MPTAPNAATPSAPPPSPAAQAGPGPEAVADPAALAREIAAAVLAHPSVARLHAGRFGDIATLMPGRRLVGVRIGSRAEPVELGVVLHVDRPIPVVVAELRRMVARRCGGAAVDITVGDLELPADVAALLAGGPS